MLGDYVYQSKKELAEKIGSFLERSADGVVTNELANKKLHLLIKNHPDACRKIGTGIDHFEIEHNHVGWGRGFVIVRVDNSRERFSYKKCIYGYRQDKKEAVIEAFRVCIRSQIKEFRQAAVFPLACAISGIKIYDHGKLHVDHKIPFKVILDDFLSLYNLELLNIKTIGNAENLQLASADLCKRFYDYHKENAILRYTLMEYNLKRK